MCFYLFLVSLIIYQLISKFSPLSYEKIIYIYYPTKLGKNQEFWGNLTKFLVFKTSSYQVKNELNAIVVSLINKISKKYLKNMNNINII